MIAFFPTVQTALHCSTLPRKVKVAPSSIARMPVPLAPLPEAPLHDNAGTGPPPACCSPPAPETPMTTRYPVGTWIVCPLSILAVSPFPGTPPPQAVHFEESFQLPLANERQVLAKTAVERKHKQMRALIIAAS